MALDNISWVVEMHMMAILERENLRAGAGMIGHVGLCIVASLKRA